MYLHLRVILGLLVKIGHTRVNTVTIALNE